MKKTNFIGMTLGLSAALLLAACGNNEEQAVSGNEATGTTESVGEAIEYTITGIEPGAGIMGMADDTLETYENLNGWELETSSTAGMLVQLEQAIDNEEPIIVTGWAPHYKFVEHDLKFLEDPEGTMGDIEGAHTIARLGLKEEMPNAYQILDSFNWEIDDVESVMYEAQESSYEEAAQNWVDENQDKIDEWLEGTEQVDGEQIEVVSTQWDTERASSLVIQAALEQQGYDVTITEVDPAVMFEALANGEADVSVAPWLPVTHGAFYENNEENIDDLGPNMTGTQNGFVVPAYMDIDSIEDLEPNPN